MEKRLMMLLVGLFLSLGMALAQTQISGTVTSSEDGQPIIGASVKVEGTKMGTVTDVDGNFSLSAPANSKLEISYIGMVSKIITVKGKDLKVVLSPDNKTLDEVMVVAYGTEKRSAFTGSAKVIGADEIGKVQVTNAVDALKGQVAGVQINSVSGQPGSASSVRIRGISSVNAGNSPLIVLDGVAYDGDINTITPSDIESMTVLKDAASTALYGARGSNGVILITTKKGKNGTGTITVDAKWGSNSRAVPNYNMVKSPAKYYEMWYSSLKSYAMKNKGLSSDAAAAWANKNLINSTSYGLGYNVYTIPSGESMIGSDGKLNPNAKLGSVYTYKGNQYTLTPDNWSDATFKHSLRQEYTVSGSGASDRGSFYTSFNYLNYDGITTSSSYERYSGRVKADYKVKDWLKMSGNANFSHYTQNNTGQDEGSSSSSGNVFALTKMGPIYPLYIRDGNGNIMFDKNSGINYYDYGDGKVNGLNRPYLSQSNPLSSLQLDENKVVGNMVNTTLSADVTLPYGFKFTSTNNATVDEDRQTNTTNPFYGQYTASNGIVYKYSYRYFTYDLQQLLNWSQSYGKNTISAVLGHDYYSRNYAYLEGDKNNQYSPSNDELAGAINVGSTNSYQRDYNNEGYFFRALYDYDNKYHGEFSVVRQASSRFAKDNRWGDFWSAGTSWVISKEKWFKVDWVDELRAKLSYGQTGNDNIGNDVIGYDLYSNVYDIVNSDGNPGLVVRSVKGNSGISWETNKELNFGIESSLFKGRLNVTLDGFSRKTANMLYEFTYPLSYGYTSYYDNIGDMMNNGFEADINGDIIQTKDLRWSANANFTYVHNYLSYLPDSKKTITVDGIQGYTNKNFFLGQGKSVFTWYLPQYAGVDPKTGAALYYKTTTDDKGNQTTTTTTTASEATYHLCGSAMPEIYGGFGSSLAWKGLDFSVSFAYQIGGKIYDSDYQSLMGATRGEAFSTDLYNAWTPENTNTNIPRIMFNDDDASAESDRWLTNASYLSLQNVTLGYTFPKQWVSRIGLGTLRVYVTADNVWVWSHRKGLDPRQAVYGDDHQYTTYSAGEGNSSFAPGIRTISGGLTVTF
jgi:TonB-linked SusC/RagA family outer membrane protein